MKNKKKKIEVDTDTGEFQELPVEERISISLSRIARYMGQLDATMSRIDVSLAALAQQTAATSPVMNKLTRLESMMEDMKRRAAK